MDMDLWLSYGSGRNWSNWDSFYGSMFCWKSQKWLLLKLESIKNSNKRERENMTKTIKNMSNIYDLNIEYFYFILWWSCHYNSGNLVQSWIDYIFWETWSSWNQRIYILECQNWLGSNQRRSIFCDSLVWKMEMDIWLSNGSGYLI